ncbi:MAG: TonB family protein [Spirochaetes bacterium]|nr:TonB family protein [Spirochaetota bacterium]
MKFKYCVIISIFVHAALVSGFYLTAGSRNRSAVFSFENSSILITASVSSGAQHAEREFNQTVEIPESTGNDGGNDGSEGSNGSDGVRNVIRAEISSLSVSRPPSYPLFCRNNNIEGDVVLEIEIRTDGTIGEVKIADFSGSRLFASAAAEAASSWKLSAEIKTPIESFLIRQKISFRLQD